VTRALFALTAIHHDAAAIFPDCVDGRSQQDERRIRAHISNEQVLKITAYVVSINGKPDSVKLLKAEIMANRNGNEQQSRHGRRYACWFPYCFWGPCLPGGEQPIIAFVRRIAAQTGCRRGRVLPESPRKRLHW